MIRAAALVIALLAAGCAPVIIPAGPATTMPVLQDDAIIAADGARLPLRRFAPEGEPRAVVLALHGFNDHSGNFLSDSIEAFRQGGMLVYAYDQRGFGRAPNRGYWAGAETLAADAAAAARLLRARHPGLPFHVMGESMGAAVAILAATGPDPPPADSYVLLAPALWQRSLMNPLMRGSLWAARRFIPAVPFQGGVGGIVASDNEAALRRLGRDPLVIRNTRVDAAIGLIELMEDAVAALPRCCPGAGGAEVPALLLYGARDMIVPGRMTRAAVLSLRPGTRLRMGVYDEGYHLLLSGRNREEVVLDILAFLANPAAPLPSGAEANTQAWINR